MKFWVKGAAIFAVGFLLGGATFGLVIHHCFGHMGGGPPNSDMILKMLSSKLSLTSDQKDKVSALLKIEGPKMEALHQESQARFKTQRDSFNAKLRLLLNADQQKKQDEMIAKWESRDHDKNCRPFGCGTLGLTPTVPGK
jgi:hypothetical protein